jgi:hypothetical protein
MTTSLGATRRRLQRHRQPAPLQTAKSGAQKLLRFCVPCDPGALMFARAIAESVGGLVANVISQSQGPGAEKRNSSAVMTSTSPRADRTTMPNPEVNVGPVVQGPGPREFHPDLLTHPQILILGETARFGRRALASALAQRDSGSPFGRRRAGGWDIEHNS